MKPIPIFDVDEIFDKASKEKLPPFYLIYGWLILNHYGNEEVNDNVSRRLADTRLGLDLDIIKFHVSKNRKRNVRIIKMFEDITQITLSFEGEYGWVANDLYYSTDEGKYTKYLLYEEPFDYGKPEE